MEWRLRERIAFVATKVWDQNSHGHLNFDAKDEGIDYLGYIIENDVIQSLIYKAVESSQVTMIQSSLEALNSLIWVMMQD